MNIDGRCGKCGLLMTASGKCSCENNIAWLTYGNSKGWECPKCGRCYSPTTNMCMYCGPNYYYPHYTYTITCKGTNWNE